MDRLVANGVLTSIYRHLWYLSEELVVLTLADEESKTATRQELAEALVAADRP